MAIKANFTIDQGSDFEAAIDVVQGADTVYDLTNHSVEAQMRKSYASTSYHSFTTSHNSAGGKIILSMTNAETGAITPGRYLYDVEITDLDTGKITRVVQGVITVSPGITR